MSDIQLTRLPGYDINGNPRYVCHYTHLLTEKEGNNDYPVSYTHLTLPTILRV